MSAPALTFSSIREVLPPVVYQRSYAWALGLVSATMALNLALLWASYTAQSVAGLLLFAIARGLSIGPVFIVGHDACHNALSPSSRLNHWLGQLCFLPSWHVFTAWKVRHNHIHHRHTNVIELDSGYPPLTPAQYQAASPSRRFLYRLSRTPLGAGFLYWPEAIAKHLFPSASQRKAYRQVDRVFTFEWLLVWLAAGLEAALFSGVLAAAGLVQESPTGGWQLFIIGFVVTHAVWNWQMGFTTFLHHFHPAVHWHEKQDAISAAERQLTATVHVDLGHLHFAMLNIFVHTAHHLDTAIPLYRLPQAQHALQARFGDRILRWQFTLSGALACFRQCKLWNQEEKRWNGFSVSR